MGKPEEVADVLMFLLSDKAAYVTGGSNPRILGFEID
jgi:NAD(P)-dependent dehydrogenase (short-subunit alcohol dehydrogenase family)